MKILILVFLFFTIFFVINIIYEYVHTFKLKKKKSKKNNSKNILLQFFLHIHILNDIIFYCICNFIIKLKLITYSIYVMITFNNKLYEYIPRENSNILDNFNLNYESKNYEIKTIYLIRHGESLWNNSFNKKFNLKTAFNIILLFFYEIVFLFTKKTVLFDSPLSISGIIESLELSNFLKNENKNEKHIFENFNLVKDIENNENNNFENIDRENIINEHINEKNIENKNNLIQNRNENLQTSKIDNVSMKKNIKTNKNSNEIYNPHEIINLSINDHIDILNNVKYKSIILSSNLRRAISTCLISFDNRINNFNEHIYVLNSLKEVSRNPDSIPSINFIKKYIPTHLEKFVHKNIKNLYKNNIHIINTYINNQFIDTLNYIFHPNNNDNNIFIIFGHSLWFKYFFNIFLRNHHKLKTHKLQNTGIVCFNLIKYVDNKNVKYEIINDSIRIIYKGYEEKKNI